MYAFLSSRPIEYNNSDDDNHIYIHMLAGKEHFTVAVNVESNTCESRLYYAVKEYSAADVNENKYLREYIDRAEGLYLKDNFPRSLRLDYWEQKWVTADEMIPAEIRHSADNDLGKILVEHTKSAMSDDKAKIITLGQLWGPKDERDWTFGFRPAQGIHDVHCNQSSPMNSRWIADDRPGRDGAIFFFLPSEEKVVGVFTMFK